MEILLDVSIEVIKEFRLVEVAGMVLVVIIESIGSIEAVVIVAETVFAAMLTVFVPMGSIVAVEELTAVEV